MQEQPDRTMPDPIQIPDKEEWHDSDRPMENSRKTALEQLVQAKYSGLNSLTNEHKQFLIQKELDLFLNSNSGREYFEKLGKKLIEIRKE